MSTAPTKHVLLSTLGLKGTASMSQAGHVASKVTALYKDIAEDLVKKIQECTFDQFLLHSLSLCLAGDAKATFEKSQNKIEALQHKRFTDTSEADASREENDLIEQRDNALKEYLNMVLQDVVKLANEAGDVRAHLEKFINTLYEVEEARYAPWIDLCNAALKQLKNRNYPFLRKAADLDLRTCRNDPQSVPTIIEGAKRSPIRKPDFVRTSYKAAKHVHPNNETPTGSEETFSKRPNHNFVWSQVLSCEEMKAHSRQPSAPVVTLAKKFEQHRFIVTSTPAHHDIAPDNVIPAADSTSQVGGKRSRVDNSVKSESSMKEARDSTQTSKTTAKEPQESTSNKQVSARVQVAQYAMDMLSHGTGVKHVINTLIVDECLWVWFYDRQGIIQSKSINIVVDFPRVLVLLLLFQRFTLEDWGIIPCLNPQAAIHLGITSTGYNTRTKSIKTESIPDFGLSLGKENFSQHRLTNQEEIAFPDKPLTINHNRYLSHRPYSLSGRATSVLEGKWGDVDTAVKIYNPEVQRSHEGNILKLVGDIATKYDKAMLEHLPRLYFSGDIKGCTTLRVRSMLLLSGKGYRTTRVLVLRKLERLTTQKGDSFVKCWLETITCHAFLWRHGVEHGDPSLSNVMYDPAKNCGVLTDFDLSIIKWLPRVPGTERTGTVPYMALEILSKDYWDGLVTRHYHHELEAFMWIIPVVFHSRTKNDKLLPEGTIVADWMTPDFNECCKSKSIYLTRTDEKRYSVQDPYKSQRILLLHLCLLLRKQRRALEELNDKGGAEEPNEDGALEELNEETARTASQLTSEDRLMLSQNMWDLLMDALCQMKLPVVKPFIPKLAARNPTEAENEDSRKLFDELEKMYDAILKSATAK